MKASFTYKVSNAPHFTGDLIVVTFSELEHPEGSQILYEGVATFDLRGTNPVDLTATINNYETGAYRENDRERAHAWGHFWKGNSAIIRLVKESWKDIVHQLCLAKQHKIEIQLGIAQRRVEKLIEARDKLRAFTGE